MDRNIVQFFYILTARALDFIGLLVVAPAMFYFFGNEFRMSINFFAIATFAVLL